VREAVFNSLASLDRLRDATVLDLFAGSGALGIEALSRGAAHCTFVEQARPGLQALRANLAALGLDHQATVVPMDALRYLSAERPSVDLVLADPPYAFDGWPDLLGRVRGSFVVAESRAPIGTINGWEVVRSRRYGRTTVTFLQAQA
jgi:16S rRNA (guanine966-N2)-methyltransferase